MKNLLFLDFGENLDNVYGLFLTLTCADSCLVSGINWVEVEDEDFSSSGDLTFPYPVVDLTRPSKFGKTYFFHCCLRSASLKRCSLVSFVAVTTFL